MNTVKPLVIFVFPYEGTESSTKYGGFARRLKRYGGLKGCDTLTVALENLMFIVHENGEADVIDAVSGRSLGEATFVYLKSWEALPEEASALANYLFYKGVPFIDTASIGVGVSKLATAFRLWGNGVKVPLTLYVRNHAHMGALLAEHASLLGERFIVKDIQGAKGKMNFFASPKEALSIIAEHPTVQFVIQRFIPNDGDYRIGVYVDNARFAIKRVGSGESHLNNTSAGGKALYIAIADLPKKLVRIAEEASSAVDLQVSGVDIIVDKATDKSYVLEVNQGSQIVTGAFVEENIAAFNEGLNEAIKNRYARSRKKPTRVIGRRVMAKVPELGIARAIAKVDTGAYTSSLHAENIRIETAADGHEELVFEVPSSELLQTINGEAFTVRTAHFFDQKVRSSNGALSHRYSIRVKMTIEGKIFPVALTLSDRSQMGYPLLLGRRALRSRFMVNVELNEEHKPVWKY